MIRRDVPAFNIATRGMAYFHVTVRTGERDLHSGMYGGAALNAAHALIRTLDGLIAHDGTLADALRAGRAAPTDEELAGWAELPAGADELADQGARPKDDRRCVGLLPAHLRRAGDRRERDRNRLAAAAEDRAARRGGRERVDPPRARTEGRGDRARRRAASARERACRRGRRRRAVVVVSAGLVPPDSRVIQLGLDAFERALGRRPALVRSGGTLPIVPALTDKGIATVITGFGLPDSQIHSPNERLVAEYVPAGIRAARELLLAFAQL